MFNASRRVGEVLLIATLVASPLLARAQVYKCVQANGSVGYQGTPCASNAKPASRPTAEQLNPQRGAAPRDDRPYSDPYSNNASSRPHATSPGSQEPPAPSDPTSAQKSQRLVAEVQARNRRENELQAFKDAHQNDKTVDAAACNDARQTLNILNEQHPVFSYDDKGNRVFIEDKDRPSRIAEAQQSIRQNCP